MTIVIDDEIVPEFTQIGPLCLNSAAPALPTVSNNGITGFWTPSVINTTVLGPADYVFTPDAGQCGVEYTMTIVVDDEIVPEFTQIGPLCLNSAAPTLPTVSNNGITGFWTPSVINTTVLGPADYVFTPDAGQCGVEITMTIVIDDEIVPEFTQIGPLCLNSAAPTLPTVSNNGITGSWNPSTINTTVLGSSDYVFTPDAGQCGVEITMTIVIEDEIVPEFTQIGPLCLNSAAPTLPTTSNNGISGSWTPSTINTTVLGTSDYVFTPDAGQCGVEITMTIVIDDEIVPEFTQIGPLCLNIAAPALPTTSNNGITGFWTPSVINTTVLGSSDYVFSPDAGQCGVEYTMTIVIDDEIVPEFTQIGPLCLNSTAPTLPTVSNNGITGFWTPSTINTTVLGPADYVFTPDAGQCGVEIIMTIVIDDEIVPEFTQIGPLCLNSAAPTLPTVSNNGITGFWTPSVINTTVLGPADYVFTPDAGQCSVEVVMTVNIDSPVIINIETTPATNGLPNGEARIIASGGLAPLEYSINGIDWYPLNEFNGLAADVYTAYVRDARGCEISQEFTITNSVVAEVLVSAQEVESCLNVPIELPVFSENFIDVVSFTLVLTFDDAMVTYLNLVNIHPLLEAISPPSIELAAGQITIRYSAAPGSVTLPTNAQLFGILFNGMNPGNVNFNWSFDECLILSAEGYEIPKSLVPGSVEILPAPALQVYAGGAYCEGDSTIFRAVNQDTQQLNYVWTRPDGSLFNSSELVLNPLKISDNGVYNFMATNPEGCSVAETFSLVVNPGAFVNISDTDSLCAGTMHFLDAGSGFETYLWQDGSNLQTYTATEAGEYRVEVVNSYGCEGSSSVWLVPCTLELTMPNAFTPNGDRINDVFKPVLLGDITPSRFLMQIYNKWGELVYETSDYSAGWNGFVKGSLAPAGVYAFVINFEVPGYINVTVKSPVRGSVTLLR
jgi:gliding motility-associated-like protein